MLVKAYQLPGNADGSLKLFVQQQHSKFNPLLPISILYRDIGAGWTTRYALIGSVMNEHTGRPKEESSHESTK